MKSSLNTTTLLLSVPERRRTSERGMEDLKIIVPRSPVGMPFRVSGQVATSAILFAVVCTGAIRFPCLQAQEQNVTSEITVEQADKFAQLALRGILQEFPNKPSNVMASASDVRGPRDMHPAFYGCFDWHSAVHGHWMLVRLLKVTPALQSADDIRRLLRTQLTKDNMQQESLYFEQPHNKSFERMYGWAWLLQLARELEGWDDEDARVWRENLKPLEDIIVKRAMDYLPKLSFPIRVGTHTDTSFALGMALDYARVMGNEEFEKLLVAKSLEFYQDDTNYPAHYEPSGHDFFSSGLNEADLMRRVLSAKDYSAWLDRFLPGLETGDLGTMIEPVEVTDVTDGHLVHLAGLDLARAWTMSGIVSALDDADPAKQVLQDAIPPHLKAGLKYVNSGHYEGEHWLATFAVYHMTRSGLEVEAD